jgi:DNA-binding MarR family transcriptional regulator
MKITVNTTDENYIFLYLHIWKSTFKLTDAELNVLEAIVRRYNRFKAEGIKEDYIPDLLFTSRARKEMQDALGYSQQHFNNVVKVLKDKKIIAPVRDTYYIRDRRVIPTAEVTFKFVPNADQGR